MAGKGGACAGPRYQVPVLPFYIILLLAIPEKVWFTVIQGILLIPSFINMFLCTAISPMVPKNIVSPLLAYYNGLSILVSSQDNILQPYVLPIRLQTRDLPAVQRYSAFNLGNLMGLSDLWSLIPWFLVSFTAFWLMWKRCRQKKLSNKE